MFVGVLLDAIGRRVADLPVPTGTQFASKDGTKGYLCWNAVLGQCKFGKGCRYRRNHPGKGELADAFAATVVSMLKPAVDHVTLTKDATGGKNLKSRELHQQGNDHSYWDPLHSHPLGKGVQMFAQHLERWAQHPHQATPKQELKPQRLVSTSAYNSSRWEERTGTILDNGKGKISPICNLTSISQPGERELHQQNKAETERLHANDTCIKVINSITTEHASLDNSAATDLKQASLDNSAAIAPSEPSSNLNLGCAFLPKKCTTHANDANFPNAPSKQSIESDLGCAHSPKPKIAWPLSEGNGVDGLHPPLLATSNKSVLGLDKNVL